MTVLLRAVALMEREATELLRDIALVEREATELFKEAMFVATLDRFELSD
jgi:hypothetical protein